MGVVARFPKSESFGFLQGGQKNQKSLVGVDQKKPLLPGFIREYKRINPGMTHIPSITLKTWST